MSTRVRFTIANSVLMALGIVLFGTAVYIAQPIVAESRITERTAAIADDLVRLVIRAHINSTIETTRRTPLTVVDSSGDAPMIKATPAMDLLLGPQPVYVMVFDDTRSEPYYYSYLVRLLPDEPRHELFQYAADLQPAQSRGVTRGVAVPIVLDTERFSRVVLIARNDAGLPPTIRKIVVGYPSDARELPATIVLGTMFAVAPVVFLLALIAAYIAAGRIFSPVEQIIDDVEDIADGRSLHRRLPPDPGNDEIARLSGTLNAMLSRLEQSFAALRRFTADASHELKTPLTVLRADVERAMHPETSRSDRMVSLEEALQEIARMSDLVDSLLTLARADEGRFDIHREPVALEPVIRDVYETALILGEEAELTIVMPALEPVVVLGDRTRLRHLLLNLVTNAIKYTPKGGRVEVSAVRRGMDEVVIAVRDTGIGIAAGDLPHVFERFWRADRARSRASERGGNGLGLAIASWTAQAHGGTLTVQSRLGRGSVFTVTLPAIPLDPPVPAAPTAAIAAGSGQGDANSAFTDS